MTAKNTRILVISAAAILAVAGGFLLAQQMVKTSGRGGAVAKTLRSGALPSEMIDFTLPDLDGKPRHLSSWKGKLLIVNFWATWCPPCRKEIPLFIDMQQKYGDRGLQIIGVAVDKTEAVKNFRDFSFINYPILTGQQNVMDIMAEYGNRIASLPYSVIIDAKGHVLGRKVGAYHQAELSALLDTLLPPGA
ncbi:MAG: TlpA disulfide reductase family protein [Acidiferrobacteraceae bacterium]|jgi:thiol-disulfide isomerase/thioredoxin